MTDIILSKLFLNKLFKFFFTRNSKIFKSLAYIYMVVIITIVYTIVFFVRINSVISGFTTSNYSYSLFMILILIILIAFSFYLVIQFNKLQKETKFSFLDEIAKTYPANSSEHIVINEEGLKSSNSTQNHVYFFQYNDISSYYKCGSVYIFQSLDDSFIFIDSADFPKEEIKKIVREHHLKKRFLLHANKKPIEE